jgi:hypothetical protein
MGFYCEDVGGRNDEGMGDREEEAEKSKDIHSTDHTPSSAHFIFFPLFLI